MTRLQNESSEKPSSYSRLKNWSRHVFGSVQHPVEKQRLLELSLVGEAEFTSVCRSMLVGWGGWGGAAWGMGLLVQPSWDGSGWSLYGQVGVLQHCLRLREAVNVGLFTASSPGTGVGAVVGCR